MGIAIGLGWGIATDNDIYNKYADVFNYIDKNNSEYFTNMPVGKEYEKTVHGSKPADYFQIINSTSRKYNIEPSLVNAVIKVESNWDSKAVSQKGAQGLM